MHVKRCLFYMGALGGKLYAVCGWAAPDKSTRTVEVYDPLTDTWSHCSHLDDKPHEHAGTLTADVSMSANAHMYYGNKTYCIYLLARSQPHVIHCLC